MPQFVVNLVKHTDNLLRQFPVLKSAFIRVHPRLLSPSLNPRSSALIRGQSLQGPRFYHPRRLDTAGRLINDPTRTGAGPPSVLADSPLRNLTENPRPLHVPPTPT